VKVLRRRRESCHRNSVGFSMKWVSVQIETSKKKTVSGCINGFD